MKTTIAKGVANNLFAYCQIKGTSVSNVVIGKTIPANEIELSNEVAILQPEEAKKYQEPRKLSKIEIIPSKIAAQKGEKICCRISGYAQFGDSIEVSGASVIADGGSIDENGQIECNAVGKLFIKASYEGITGIVFFRHQGFYKIVLLSLVLPLFFRRL